jgi:hypothetical protein
MELQQNGIFGGLIKRYPYLPKIERGREIY